MLASRLASIRPPALLLLLLGALSFGAAAPVPADDAVWPLDPAPRAVHGFDPPAVTWGAGHRGVDLLGRPGQAVRASRGGVVTYAGRLAGRGVVVVSHGATRTTYEPVAAEVAVGDPVTAGSPVGRLLRAGSHCLPATCLHWGLRRGGTYLDPLGLLGPRPVRLLPDASGDSVGTPARVTPATGLRLRTSPSPPPVRMGRAVGAPVESTLH